MKSCWVPLCAVITGLVPVTRAADRIMKATHFVCVTLDTRDRPGHDNGGRENLKSGQDSIHGLRPIGDPAQGDDQIFFWFHEDCVAACTFGGEGFGAGFL